MHRKKDFLIKYGGELNWKSILVRTSFKDNWAQPRRTHLLSYLLCTKMNFTVAERNLIKVDLLNDG